MKAKDKEKLAEITRKGFKYLRIASYAVAGILAVFGVAVATLPGGTIAGVALIVSGLALFYFSRRHLRLPAESEG